MLTLDDFNLVTTEDRDDLSELSGQMAEKVWPEFMRNDPIGNKNWHLLYEKHPCHQFALTNKEDDQIIVFGNSLPVTFKGDLIDLPDKGWDWAIESGCSDENVSPNYLCAIQIMVVPDVRAKGISYVAIEAMRSLGKAAGLDKMLAPIRPNQKCDYPLTPMEEYIEWKDEKGQNFDAWLRVHSRVGGRMIKVCPEAMTIPGTVSEWEKWAKMRFPSSGRYVVPGALNPVEISIEADRGLYIEPNIWIEHS